MKDNQIWSTSLGRWCGIPVRLHLFLVLFVVLLFGAEWNVGYPNTNFLRGTAMVTFLVLGVSIIVHELAHAFAVVSIGGRVEQIVLMPWGGNSEYVIPDRGVLTVVAHAAGAFANGMLFLFGLTLLIQTDYQSLSQLINPFQPHWFVLSDWKHSLVEIFTWVNFQLMMVNLVPCFPFDGAAIVRSIIRSVRLELPAYRIEVAVKLLGNLCAFGLIGSAYLLRHSELGLIKPAWLFMVLVGVTLLYAARYSLHNETEEYEEEWTELDELEYTASLYESGGLYSDSPIHEGNDFVYSQWLSEKQESRRQREIMIEQEEDERADLILEKLHQHGGNLEVLSPEERMILDRFSERIRRRRQFS